MDYVLINKEEDDRYDHLELETGIEEWCPAALTHAVQAHKGYFVYQRKYGTVAIKYKCLAQFTNGQSGKTFNCVGTITKSTGVSNWGQHRGTTPNIKKAPTLWALDHLGGIATVSDIAAMTGLTNSEVNNTLHSCWRARVPYVTRSEAKLPTAISYAYEWTISTRGKLWLLWAQKKGLIYWE